MAFQPFELERWQSRYEHEVSHNLSESGVSPLTPRELLNMGGIGEAVLLDAPLEYSQGNGSLELRRAIAALYPGADESNVVVTTGSAEANFLVAWSLLSAGGNVAMMQPNYLQLRGMAQNLGCQVTDYLLDPNNGWEPNRDSLENAVTARTDLVAITNPNNPTGHVLSSASLDEIIDRARAAGAWVVVDEVYRGSEVTGIETPTAWGGYDKLVIINGLSKAYGLPGLRIGWAIGPPDFVEGLWSRHDYTTICPTPLSDILARVALDNRDALLQRTRQIISRNLRVMAEFLENFPEAGWIRPDAGAIAFVDFGDGFDSAAAAERLRVEHDLLVVTGEHFGMPGYLRIGLGNPTEDFERSLAILGEGLQRCLA